MAVMLCALLASCGTYMEVYHASPLTDGEWKIEDRYPVYDNDTIRIVYDLWDKNGIMRFAIFNKYSKPIYIDWKKCSFILNGTKNDYYDESVTTSAIEFGISYRDLFGQRIKKGASVSESTKKERIMFIPPKSGVRLTTYSIYAPVAVIKNIKSADREMKREGKYLIPVKKEDAKVKFRNFITYSTTESFAQEKYVDNGFYISSISAYRQGTGNFVTMASTMHDPAGYYNYPIPRSSLKK